MAEKRNDSIPRSIALLSTVRASQHDCYERIVFDFKDENLPEFQVAVASPPFSGSSGVPIPVAGNRFVKVRLGTTYARYPGTGNYAGPDSIQPAGLTVIREIRLIEDFEAVVIWAIGVDADRSFRVGTLTNPIRVYVDIARS
jgi:hypothetical protein